MLKFFLGLSVAVSGVLAFLFFHPQNISDNLVQVERIIDGDTFVVKGNQQIRLLSVNAPEPNLCGGQQATEKLTDLISGKKVRLVGDINDTFGRLLALVYVDDLLVNQEMISSGWARFTSTASPESETLKAAFNQAKEEQVGIFSNLCLQNTNPNNPECNIKGNIREGKKTYFFLGCGNYSNVAMELDQGDQWFCSEAEAVAAGFTKAVNCHDKIYK